MTKFEVTTERITLKGRARRTMVVEADSFTQTKGTAMFIANERPEAVVKHVVRICWS